MFPLRDSNSYKTFPLTTYSLIVINVVAFLTFKFRLSGDIELLQGLTLVPGKMEWCVANIELITQNPGVFIHSLIQPFFASMFLHADWPHLLGNMWFLFVFGRAVEGRLGSFGFLGFYLTFGVAAGLFHVIVTLEMESQAVNLLGSVVQMDGMGKMIPVVGASGAIAGVLGAYFFLHPLARILVFFPPFFLFHIPALFFIGFWFAYQMISANAVTCESVVYCGVAWWAHIGGFLAGLALISIYHLFKSDQPPEPRNV